MDKKGAHCLWTRKEHTKDKKGANHLWTRKEHAFYGQETSTLYMYKKGAHCLWTRKEHAIYRQEWSTLSMDKNGGFYMYYYGQLWKQRATLYTLISSNELLSSIIHCS